jgi:hypothetical protein
MRLPMSEGSYDEKRPGGSETFAVACVLRGPVDGVQREHRQVSLDSRPNGATTPFRASPSGTPRQQSNLRTG